MSTELKKCVNGLQCVKNGFGKTSYFTRNVTQHLPQLPRGWTYQYDEELDLIEFMYERVWYEMLLYDLFMLAWIVFAYYVYPM